MQLLASARAQVRVALGFPKFTCVDNCYPSRAPSQLNLLYCLPSCKLVDTVREMSRTVPAVTRCRKCTELMRNAIVSHKQPSENKQKKPYSCKGRPVKKCS
jgi:bacterioferritin-associated ferredoxin